MTPPDRGYRRRVTLPVAPAAQRNPAPNLARTTGRTLQRVDTLQHECGARVKSKVRVDGHAVCCLGETKAFDPVPLFYPGRGAKSFEMLCALPCLLRIQVCPKMCPVGRSFPQLLGREVRVALHHPRRGYHEWRSRLPVSRCRGGVGSMPRTASGPRCMPVDAEAPSSSEDQGSPRVDRDCHAQQ